MFYTSERRKSRFVLVKATISRYTEVTQGLSKFLIIIIISIFRKIQSAGLMICLDIIHKYNDSK